MKYTQKCVRKYVQNTIIIVIIKSTKNVQDKTLRTECQNIQTEYATTQLLMLCVNVIHIYTHTSLLISNDEFSLTPTNRDKGIDSFNTRQHGLLHRLPGDDAGSFDPHSLSFNSTERALVG